MPGPPSIPEIDEMFKRAVTLTWNPPINDGGDKIANYIVEYKLDDDFKWTTASEGEKFVETSYKVTGLKEKEKYEFRVAAVNRAGRGPFSQTDTAIKVQEPIVGKAPKIISKIEDQTAIGKEVIKIECGVDIGQPESEILWFKGDKQLRSGRRYEFIYWNKVATLVIKDGDGKDTDDYKCVVSNPLGKVESSGKLTVIGKCKFTSK